MTKTMTLRGLLPALLLVAGFQVSFAQAPFWTETFSNQGTATTNWVHGGTNAGTETWTWSNDPLAGFMDPNLPGFTSSVSATTGYFLFNSDGNGENDHDVTLTGVGVPASCTGKSGVHLRFNTQYIYFNAGATAAIGISTNGTDFVYGTLFNGLAANAIYDGPIDVDLSTVADGQSQVWIQFRWVGNYEYHWKVDDLELYEDTPDAIDVTFRVNMALQTVDPAGAFIAGSFNNWTDEAMTNEGNGVWSITKQLTEGQSYQYKFKNGPNGWEQAPQACGVDDGFGGFNRQVVVGSEPIDLAAVCFSSCDPCVVPCNLNPNAIICDNFDSYNPAQKLGPQATWWTTWSGTEGTNEDGIVSAEQSSSPTQSLKLVSTSPNGGPQDVVLNLGNKTNGHYELKWKIFIPAGKQAYYNIQNNVPIPASPVTEDWNLDVFFEANGAGRVGIENVDQNAFTYANAEWLEVVHDVDLDNNTLRLWIGGNYVGTYPYPDNLGGIDFYCISNTNQFYIDDVEYVSLPPVVFNVDVCEAAVDLTGYLGGTPGVAQTTGIFDNTNATVSASDPDVTCWNETTGADIIDGSMWYTFIGDGGLYHFETVPCDATNYIGTEQQDPGDTQMLIYAGDNCDDLTEVACNDDFFPTGDPDWRSAVDLQTEAGQTYYMLIDGFNFQGTVALGEFCIEISQVASVTCADGAVGTYEMPNPFVCFEANLANQVTIDEASFVLPNEGPVSGLAWAISTQPITAGTWPADQAGFVGGTGFLDAPFVVGLPNDASIFAAGIYYIAPVVLGGGTIIDPAVGAAIFNVDPSNGCFFVGASTQIFLLPLLDDVTATAVAGNGTVDLTPGGGLGALLGDDSFYTYDWSNGATTQDLAGVPSGTYTCVVNDVSGCALEAIVTVQVSVGTKDPASVQSFTVSPNPTTGTVVVNLALATTSDVRVEVLNTLGQTMQTLNLGKVNNLQQPVELGNLPQGAYFLRVTVDGETAIRRVVVQR